MGILNLPVIYSAAVPFRYFSHPLLDHGDKMGNFLGLVNERNEIMVRRVLEYVQNHPEEVAMVRLGAGHVPGMMELFREYGDLHCTNIDKEKFLQNYQKLSETVNR